MTIKKNYNLFDTNIKLNSILNSINNFDTIQKKKNINCDNMNKFLASKLFDMYDCFCDNTEKKKDTNNELFCKQMKELKNKMEIEF